MIEHLFFSNVSTLTEKSHTASLFKFVDLDMTPEPHTGRSIVFILLIGESSRPYYASYLSVICKSALNYIILTFSLIVHHFEASLRPYTSILVVQ